MTPRHHCLWNDNRAGERWNTGVYLGLKVLHGLLKCFGRSSLVVTEDGHRPVGSVVRQDFCWDAVVSWRPDNGRSSLKFEIADPKKAQ